MFEQLIEDYATLDNALWLGVTVLVGIASWRRGYRAARVKHINQCFHIAAGSGEGRWIQNEDKEIVFEWGKYNG